MNVPFLVSSRDRTTLIKVVDSALHFGFDPIVVFDNGSTYEPLLEWYQTCPFEVRRLGGNFGPRMFWDFGKDLMRGRGHYCCCDNDIDFAGVPGDLIAVCRDALDRYKDVIKVGPGEYYFDLPPGLLRAEGERTLAHMWTEESRRDWLWHNGELDITCMFQRGGDRCFVYGPALRSGLPYAVKQYGWAYDPDAPPADERYYLEHLDRHFVPSVTWTRHACDALDRSKARARQDHP